MWHASLGFRPSQPLLSLKAFYPAVSEPSLAQILVLHRFRPEMAQFRPETAGKRLDIMSCMNYMDAYGCGPPWPTALNIYLAHIAC
jgi:hypothetical protein